MQQHVTPIRPGLHSLRSVLGNISRAVPEISLLAGPDDRGGQNGPGPSALLQIAPPADYAAQWGDVALARSLSVLRDPALHYALYGHAQGRRYLPRLMAGAGGAGGVKRVVVISPSHLKQCGIGEYGRYLSGEFAALGLDVTVVRTAAAARALGHDRLAGALVVVNHGPGLFDGLNPRLSQGESTTSLLIHLERMAQEDGAIPVLIHHSLLGPDHHLLYSRQSQILAAPVAQVSFVSSGARNFFLTALELGISPVAVPDAPMAGAASDQASDQGGDPFGDYPGDHPGDRSERAEVIGFFGFFQYGGKDFDALIHLARELRAKLVGSIATVNSTEAEKFEQILSEGGVAHDFTNGWIDDVALMARLAQADYFYLPQNDYDHWNNSATARFVTNLDRPLFLPPSHPFLDMADGAIFATKHDLPRIVAAIREPLHYTAAVDRVRAFRARAAMRNTAQDIVHHLPERLARMGEGLLAGPAERSVERYLELPPESRADFARATGCPADDADEAGLIAAGAPVFRPPLPVQFWRKHYELTDLIEATLLDSVHAAYRAFCKRQPTLKELIDAALVAEESGPAAGMQQAMTAALATRGSVFHNPEVVILQDGLPCDWQAEFTPARIGTTAAARTARIDRLVLLCSQIAGQIAGQSAPRPALTNVLELLVLPPAEIRARTAPAGMAAHAGLAGLDLDWIHAPRRLGERLTRLVAAASTADIALDRHFVFDLPVAPAIDPMTRQYCREDFIFLDGDLFVLNAVRCIDKRDPHPIETLVLQSLIANYDKVAVITYLLARGGARVSVSGLDEPTESLIEAELGVFIANARDPLFGLIDARNAYEIQRRHNERWWLANKPLVDACWQRFDGDMRSLIAIHAALDLPLATPATRFRGMQSYVGPNGLLFSPESCVRNAVTLRVDEALQVGSFGTDAMQAALRNFHPIEAVGAWIDGRAGQIGLGLRLARGQAPLHHPRVEIDLAFFGAARLGPRVLTVTVLCQDKRGSYWHPSAQELTLTSDEPRRVMVDCLSLRDGSYVVIDIDLSDTTSPLEAGVSTDSRNLGAMVQRIAIRSGPQDLAGPQAAVSEPVAMPQIDDRNAAGGATGTTAAAPAAATGATAGATAHSGLGAG